MAGTDAPPVDASFSAHLAPALLDLLALGSLDAERDSAAREHVAVCPQCLEGLEELLRDHQRFLEVVYPRTVDQIVERACAPGELGFVQGLLMHTRG